MYGIVGCLCVPLLFIVLWVCCTSTGMCQEYVSAGADMCGSVIQVLGEASQWWGCFPPFGNFLEMKYA